jgi:phage gp36-like protein
VHARPQKTALQAKRLEELDRLYREEVVARKRAHNALQDAKGKIRVYCRVRPMLEFEAAKNQVGSAASLEVMSKQRVRLQFQRSHQHTKGASINCSRLSRFVLLLILA